LALANSGLGAVHGFAGPIGGMFPAPHGAVCAALLPHVLQANLEAMRQRAPRHPAVDRMESIAEWLTGRPDAKSEDAIEWCTRAATAFSLPGLASWHVSRSDVPVIVRRAAQASSMKANPLLLTEEELAGILHAALAG
jgi:alcohol dehydrogenase class IV